ncbi:hypothetical protein F4808DRAFT_430827 [Astrocystis sublimbata]|nr:hypothetical protein F4808DRAFT_430827 [Astrocystis sublimbata]
MCRNPSLTATMARHVLNLATAPSRLNRLIIRFGAVPPHRSRTFTMSAPAAASQAHLMPTTRMVRWFPNTAYPLIVSAPMAFVSNHKLACEVSAANGLGFIQGGRTFKPGSRSLQDLDDSLRLARTYLAQKHQGDRQQREENPNLPIGVGFILFSSCAAKYFATTTVPILRRHRPAAIWLFAPDPEKPDTLRRVVEGIFRNLGDEGWEPRLIVQVGTVAAARQAAALGADVIVAQGVDAGGHQFVNGVGIVSLVPEVVDMVRDEFPKRAIAVWAAGGIADGRGVTAALALGAEAAVMGTRYMVAEESDAQDYKRQALISASDGANSTAKSYVHDHVQGTWNWPKQYDGRAIVHPSYTDSLAGMSIEENEARYKKAKEAGDDSMMVTWSSTSVGLIRETAPAGDITVRVRNDARMCMMRMTMSARKARLVMEAHLQDELIEVKDDGESAEKKEPPQEDKEPGNAFFNKVRVNSAGKEARQEPEPRVPDAGTGYFRKIQHHKI